MFRHDYEKVKKRKEKLTKRFHGKIERMNHVIHIRDILVYADNKNRTFGEHNQTLSSHQTGSTVSRLSDHVELLAKIANAYHVKYYCEINPDGSYAIKPDCQNKITRIALSEFSLFTQKPISIEEFSELVREVDRIASQMHSNVHLLLSTMSVVTDNDEIMNISLYVQCGDNASVQPFCKASPAGMDIHYKKTLKNPGKSEYMSDTSSMSISNNTIIQIKTAGGAEYIQAIDVCLDHAYKRSRTLIESSLSMDAANDHRLIPNQVDHLVTSNSVYIFPQITKINPVQIDPSESIAVHMPDDAVKDCDLKHTRNSKHESMRVLTDESGVYVENPPFGGDINIIATSERMLGEFNDYLKLACQKRNREIITQCVAMQLGNKHHVHDFNFISVQAKQVGFYLEVLEKSVIPQCADTFLQKIFGTNEYNMKVQVRFIIIASMSNLKKLADDDISLIRNVGKILTEMKSDILEVTSHIDYQFSGNIINSIDQAANHIKNITDTMNIRL